MTVSFDALFQHSPNAYMVLDRDLRYLEANNAYALLTGVPRAQLLGRGVFELFPGTVNPDGTNQADVLRQSLQRVIATGERDTLALIPYAIETQTPAGPELDIRYWSATHTPLRDAGGAVFAVLQHTTDVTEVERLREELRHARAATGLTQAQSDSGVLSRAAAVQRDNIRLSARQAFLTDLFAQAPGFMAVLRGEAHVFDLANAAYIALVGGRDVLGRSIREALPELAEQGFFELLDQVRGTGNPFVGRGLPVELRDAAGVMRSLNVDFIYQPIRDANGQVDGIFVQGADVTDREEALTALREGEARFRTIANLVPQMVWSTLPDGYHDYYNQRWYDFTGMPDGSTDGEGWNGMFHPDDQAIAWQRWRHSLASGEPYEIEYRLRDRNGEYQWVLGRALPVRDGSGTIVRWMGTCTAIHELKRVQQALEASQAALRVADQHKDQFLATLAHELRNPLSPIATAAQILKQGSQDAATVQRVADIIERQARHMRELVEDLIDVSRVTRGLVTLQPREAQLAEVVGAAMEQVTPLMSQRRHQLTLSDRAPGLVLSLDPVRITQVVANLLHNAAKYTPQEGTIDVVLEREGDEAVVRVRDNGMGMDEALIGRVFDLFAQAESTSARHQGGLGVGLALARSLVQLHGGVLDAHSAGIGHGSTFEMRLPLQSRVATAQA
ncbi:MAG TPA: PAS domain-containing protein [Thermomonas sp.]|nr:PAS domain-containing protein [Thermomonas sp.]